ncbi:hypothetical protein [Actinoplanes sp. GCM10030250]|uniref:hypothetical protein n=1 Tax=Actinoplanes sp. GCM10030250 TaxID=3273376 RepID=UPI00361E5E50
MTRHLIRTSSIALAGFLSAATVSAPALAAPVDRTPPTKPFVLYASGLRWTGGCLPLTIGIQRSTDNVTPQSALTYEVYADGTRLGSLTDPGTSPAVWGTLHFTHPGPQTVTARAVDAAGNRSAPSNANVITPYPC